MCLFETVDFEVGASTIKFKPGICIIRRKKKVRAYTTSMYYTHNLKSKIRLTARYWLTASKFFEKEIEAVFGKTKLILTCVGCFNRMMGTEISLNKWT